MTDIAAKLNALSSKRHSSDEDAAKFVEFVEELKLEQMLPIISENIQHIDGVQVVNHFFLGLTLKSPSQKKRFKIFEFLISELQKKDLPPKNVSTLVTWLVIELDKLSTPHLVKVSDMCVTHIGTSQTANHTCWKELLPKCLNIIKGKGEMEHYGTEMTGEEYKKQVVASLCQTEWNSSILTPLASMFINIPMESEEHHRVVSKLVSNLDDLSPEEIPPLVHQLLHLTKNQNTMVLFFALKRYYNKHLYRLDDTSAMLDATRTNNMELIESATKKDIVESESVVLYHIEDCAKRSLGCTTELLRSVKSSTSAPEIMLDPFSLAVLLTVSTIPIYESQVMDVIRSMIVRVINEEELQAKSEWVRKVLGTHCNVEKVLTMIIQSSSSDQECILKALVSLSMVLLRTVGGPKMKEKVAHKIARYGRMILVNIVKKHSHVAKTVLNMIADDIINRPELSQYTDCFGELCDTSPMVILENSQVIARLLETLPDLPEKTAYKITSSVISLMRMSSRVRDNLILVLRKSLFMHDVSTRKMAVTGFLQILKRMKIRGMSSLSQNSFQVYTCPSVFSQLSQNCLEVHSQSVSNGTNNEGLCLEVVGLLRRTLRQQYPVKLCLYDGLPRVLAKNSELCISITSLLFEHLGDYYETNEDVLPPLNFCKAIVIQKNDVIVQEPLGQLVFSLQKVLVTAESLVSHNEDDDEENELLSVCNKVKKVLDNLTKRFSSCELKHLELEEDIDGTPEGKLREESLKQVLGVYQALISYLINSWDTDMKSNGVQNLLSLYRAYNVFLDFAKNMRPKKDDAVPKKKTGLKDVTLIAGKKNTGFILPTTVVDFDVVCRLMSLLFEESVDWCSEDDIKEIRSKRPIFRFTMQLALDVIAKVKNDLSEYKSKYILEKSGLLGSLLFDNCVNSFDKMMEFDSQTAVLAVECFSELCPLILNHFRSQLPEFLELTCGIKKSEGLNNQIDKVLTVFTTIFTKTLDVEEDNEDPLTKKLLTVVSNSIYTLSNELRDKGLCTTKILHWLMDITQRKTTSLQPVSKTIVSLLLTILVRCKSDTSVHDNIALQLCDLYGTVNDMDVEKALASFTFVTHANKEAVLQMVCNALKIRLEGVNWVITRMKAELNFITQPDAVQSSPSTRKNTLKRKEKDMVQELGLIVGVTNSIASIGVPIGPAGEIICKLLHNVYSTLTAITKYFSLRSTNVNPAYQEARFGKLVKLAASHLSSQVAEFLLHIEAIDKDENRERKSVTAKTIRQAKKQTVYIPKLVSELENFTKCVTQLSNKCKDPSLTTNIKLTTTRDFRINAKKLEEVMKKNQESSDDEPEPGTSSQAKTKSQSKSKSSQASVAGSQSKRKSTQESQARKKRKTK